MNIKSTLLAMLLCLMTPFTLAYELEASTTFPSTDFIVPVNSNEMGDFGINAIVGSRDFQKVRSFPRSSDLYKLSEKIAFIYIKSKGNCTGSLVGADLLLTNQHCAFDDDNVQIPLDSYIVSFDYYAEGLKNVTKFPMYSVTELVKSSKQLDYALFRLSHPVGKEKGWFELAADNSSIRSVSGVKIIQHPAGRSKEVVLKNNRIKKIYFNEAVVHYYADTQGGSSGSPVFSENGNEIIALHHVGVTNRESKKGMFNEGILSSYIYREIKNYLPKQRVDPKPSRRVAPVKQPVTPPPSPKPVKKKPKKTSCEGKGLAITDDDGNLKCVDW